MAYSRAHVVVTGKQPVQLLSRLTALVLALIGGISLLRTHGTGLDEVTLLGLTLNPLLSWVYLDAGLLGLLWAFTSFTARAFAWILFLGSGLLFVWGLMLNGLVAADPPSWLGDPLALTVADGWWHLVISIVGLLIAVSPAHKTVHLHRPVPLAPRTEPEMDASAPSLLPSPPSMA